MGHRIQQEIRTLTDMITRLQVSKTASLSEVPYELYAQRIAIAATYDNQMGGLRMTIQQLSSAEESIAELEKEKDEQSKGNFHGYKTVY